MDTNVPNSRQLTVKDCSFLQNTNEALHVIACYNNLTKWLGMSNWLVIITSKHSKIEKSRQRETLKRKGIKYRMQYFTHGTSCLEKNVENEMNVSYLVVLKSFLSHVLVLLCHPWKKRMEEEEKQHPISGLFSALQARGWNVAGRYNAFGSTVSHFFQFYTVFELM